MACECVLFRGDFTCTDAVLHIKNYIWPLLNTDILHNIYSSYTSVIRSHCVFRSKVGMPTLKQRTSGLSSRARWWCKLSIAAFATAVRFEPWTTLLNYSTPSKHCAGFPWSWKATHSPRSVCCYQCVMAGRTRCSFPHSPSWIMMQVRVIRLHSRICDRILMHSKSWTCTLAHLLSSTSFLFFFKLSFLISL